MIGIFGNNPIDKWREKELDEYLDTRYEDEYEELDSEYDPDSIYYSDETTIESKNNEE